MTEDEMRRIFAGVEAVSGKFKTRSGKVDIAKIIDRGQQVLSALVQEGVVEAEPVKPVSAVPTPPVEEAVVTHHFVLRPGHAVAIALPQDLTAAEAERLAGFIRTIPF